MVCLYTSVELGGLEIREYIQITPESGQGVYLENMVSFERGELET